MQQTGVQKYRELVSDPYHFLCEEASAEHGKVTSMTAEGHQHHASPPAAPGAWPCQSQVLSC